MGNEIQSVLVVDDDERVLTAMSRALGSHRNVFTATNGDSASFVARREQPDLAVVDMRLGTASGIDVVRAIRADAPTMRIAVVSGYLSVDSTVAAIRAGADLVMPKPVTAMDILRRFEHATPTEADWETTPSLAQAEADHIERVLADCEGNISEAARRLRIHRTSLQRKLRKRLKR